MELLHLKDLICNINGKTKKPSLNILIKGISIDSRTIKEGEAYFAIEGDKYDGHRFIKEAIDKGASAIVYSNDEYTALNFPYMIKTDSTLVSLGKFANSYRRKFEDIKIVAITGSNGKTTTKEILSSILNTKGKTIANPGNFNNRVGLPLSLFNLNSEFKYGVFEIGTSLHGEIEILSNILRPDAGIITNIGLSHLESFIDYEGVFNEKKSLLRHIKEGGFIVINNDDQFLKTINKTGEHKVFSFGLNDSAQVYAKNIEFYPDITKFELFYKSSSVKITMSAKGSFNILNALAAAACSIGFGFSLDKIKVGIESFSPPKMRMETFITKTGIVLINDSYNANPSSVKESVNTVLQTYPTKNIYLVLGDMLELGERSINYHFDLGKFLSDKNIKAVYLIGSMTTHTKDALFGKNVFYTKDTNILLKKLQNTRFDDNSVFLFKASRGIKLEEVYMSFKCQF